MNDGSGALPRVWHLPLSGRHHDARTRRVLVGRQGIFRRDLSLAGFELLFRAPGRLGLRVDLWNPDQQNRATEHVLAAAFFGGPDLGHGLPLFVNCTRSYLVEPDRYLRPPGETVLEIVESAHADDALIAQVARLKSEGHLIAIDDYLGTRSQVRLLEHADFVKIDYRDLGARGDSLVASARVATTTLVAERVADAAALARCQDLGFDLFQGHWFEPAVVVDRPDLAAKAA